MFICVARSDQSADRNGIADAAQSPPATASSSGGMPAPTWLNQGPEPTSILTSSYISRQQLFAFRLASAFFLAYTIVAGILTVTRVPYLLYLTNWMAILNFLYFSITAAALSRSSRAGLHCAGYVLDQICIPNSIMACLLFWAAVNPFIRPDSRSHFKAFRNITDHGLTLLLLLVDFVLSDATFSISQIYWPAVSVLYIPVNAYYSIAYQPVYSALNYRTYKSAGLVVTALVVTLASFVAICWLTPKLKHGRSKRPSMQAIIIDEM